MYNGLLLEKAINDIAMTTAHVTSAATAHSMIEDICATVFTAVLEVLENVKQFGITITVQPKPNSEDFVVQTKLFENHINFLLSVYEARGQFDIVDMLLNAKQRIFHLERLINAAKRHDLEEFAQLVNTLDLHAKVL